MTSPFLNTEATIEKRIQVLTDHINSMPLPFKARAWKNLRIYLEAGNLSDNNKRKKVAYLHVTKKELPQPTNLLDGFGITVQATATFASKQARENAENLYAEAIKTIFINEGVFDLFQIQLFDNDNNDD